jgi:WD40 repeat protein
MRRRYRLLFVFWLLLFLLRPLGLPVVRANPAVTQGKSLRLDLHGDPLPPGAIARLGTERLRPGRDTLALTFCAGGKLLASAHADAYIELWDGVSGQHRGRLTTPTGVGLRCLAASPDGKRLAAGDDAHGIWLWDLATGKPPRLLQGHFANPHDLAFAPDSQTLASVARQRSYEYGGPDFAVHLWDVATGKPLRQLPGHTYSPRGVAFLPDGKHLVSTSGDLTLRLWDAAAGKEVRQCAVRGDDALAVRPLPDGKTVAVIVRGGPNTNWCEWWDVAAGKSLRRTPLPKDLDGVWGIAVSPDGRQLAVFDPYNLLLVDAATGETLRNWKAPVGQFLAVVFAPDGKRLAAATPGRIFFWEVTTGQEVTAKAAHDSHIRLLRFQSDAKTLLTLGDDSTVRVWEADTGQPLRHFAVGSGRQGYGADLSPDGRILADPRGHGDRLLALWDTMTGKLVGSVEGRSNWGTPSVVFSPDGKTLAVAFPCVQWGKALPHCDLRLVDAASGKVLHKLGSDFEEEPKVLFSPDGNYLAHWRGELRIWEVATGKKAKHGRMTRQPLFFLADGQTLALGADPDQEDLWNGGITLWNFKTGQAVPRLPTGPGTLFFAVAPGYNQVVLGMGPEGDACLRDLTTGKLLGRLTGHRGAIAKVAFSADGKRLATGGVDGTVLIWDLAALLQQQRQWHMDLTAADMENLWTCLGAAKPAALLDVMDRLVEAPAATVTMLQKRLHPVSVAGLEGWLTDLDSPQFAKRDQSMRALGRMEFAAAEGLKRVLAVKPSLELRQRVEKLLKQLDEPVTAPQLLASWRAVTVLEQIDSPQARALLKTLAQGAPQARLTQLARTALERLAKQAPALK